MNNHQKMVDIFMKACEQYVPASFTPMGYPAELRLKLIREEVDELESALEKKDWIEVIDALCDLLYVTYGAASSLGVDIEPFFEEVHRSNMSKLGLDGKPVKREDGKVIKGENYSPPDLAAVMRREKLRFYLDQVD